MIKRAFIHSIWEMWVELYDNKLFGKTPRACAYDRGGYRAENILALKKLEIKDMGLAPRDVPSGR
jgi:hypothetical protein